MADEKPKNVDDTTEYNSTSISIPKAHANFQRPASEIAEALLRQFFLEPARTVSR